MTEGAPKRLEFSAKASREAKAEKHHAILAAIDSLLNPTDDVPDLGCCFGSDSISEPTSRCRQLVCVDSDMQRPAI